MRRTLSRSRLAQAGFTLIELMVSLVIGFAVVGALLAAYMASVRSSNHSDALVQMTEDATQALNVIRSQAAMAGFSTTNIAGSAVSLDLNWQDPPLYGCAASNFATPMSNGTEASVPCTGTSASDTLEVAYEAVGGTSSTSPSNAIVNAAGTPLDCLGNTIPNQSATKKFAYVNDSKFYVDAATGSLNCFPRAGTAGAPLVDHVEALKITYGMPKSGGPLNQIETYTSAPSNWSEVISVTICVQVRSAGKVLDTNTAATLGVYVDCANNKVTNTDGYLRRTFATTVVMQNKLL